MLKMRFLLKHSMLIVFWGFFPLGGVWAQETDLSVFSSAGGSERFFLGGETVDCYWNIGEPITETFGTRPGFDASKKRLTQGFEQGEGFIEDPLDTRVEWVEGEDCQIQIYPNPLRSTLYVRLWDKSNREYTLSLHNVQGVRLYHAAGLRTGIHRMELQGLHAGVYLLEIQTGSAVKAYKLIKVS